MEQSATVQELLKLKQYVGIELDRIIGDLS
jgi:hypothetical protein